MKNIRVLQINEKDETRQFPMLFMNYDFVNVHGGLDLDCYDQVYECERSDDYRLEDAFKEFNINRPEDFTGHSLSVSDIVEIDGKKYYCDSCGWKEL